MTVTINDTEIEFPTQLSQITLGKRIEFHNNYGRELDEQLKSILAMDDGPLKDLELMMCQVDMACKTFVFFSGIDLSVVQESECLHQIMDVYNVMKHLLSEETELEAKNKFKWKGETWVIHEPELKSTSTMTFGEFVDSKQIIQDLHELGAGNWDALIRLCSIYLRKEGEAYHKSFADEGSHRYELMKELPMDIAMQVGFFLSNSMNLFLAHLQSLKDQQPKQDGSHAGTLINGAGLIS